MSDVAGWLVLGTKLNTNDFDKKYEKLKSKLEKQELDLEFKLSGVDNAKKEIEEINNEMQKVVDKRDELNKKIEKKQSNLNELLAKPNKTDDDYEWIRIYEAKIFNLKGEQEAINEELEIYNQKLNKANDKLTQAETSYKKQAENVKQTKQEIIEANNEAQKNKFKDLETSVKNIKNETEGIIKKVARWGLAIFSIRSAYLFIRRSVSTLSQYNKQIGSDLEYIQFALASVLQPVIERIIELVYKLLAYVGYLAKAWFGVDLFANTSAKSFEKAKKQLAGTNKQAKELQKTLAGFDEMNILQDGDTRTGGGGGGITLPSTDLGNFEDIEIPGWIQWLATNGELIKDIIIGIGLAIAGLKLTELVFGLSGIETTLPSIVNALGTMSGLQIFGLIGGIGVALVGVYETVKNLLTWIQDPTWENFNGVLSGLETVLIGVGIALVAVNTANPIGWITLAVGAIGLLVSALGKDETQTLSVKQATEDLKIAQDNLNKATNNYTSALDKNNKMKKQLEEAEKKAKQSGKELYNQVVLGIISFDDMTDTQKELYGKYLDSVEAEEELRKKTIEMQQANDKASVAEQKKAAAVYASTGKFNDYFNALVKGYEEGKISSQQMQNAVMNIMRSLDDDTRKTFAENLPTSIKNGFQKTLDELGRTDLKIKDVSTGITISYKDIASSTKTTFEKDVPNSVQKSINKVDSLTKSIDNLKKKGNVKMTISTTTTSSSSGMKTGGILKLASGAVINQPGRGVPLKNGVVGGEAGREGILPLTDTQAMAQLGYEIGRNVTINTTLNNYMNARLMNRELLRTQNEEDFAFNG